MVTGEQASVQFQIIPEFSSVPNNGKNGASLKYEKQFIITIGNKMITRKEIKIRLFATVYNHF